MGVDQQRSVARIEAACPHQGIEQPARAPQRDAPRLQAFDLGGDCGQRRQIAARVALIGRDQACALRTSIGSAAIVDRPRRVLRATNSRLMRSSGSGCSTMVKPAASIMRPRVVSEK